MAKLLFCGSARRAAYGVGLERERTYRGGQGGLSGERGGWWVSEYVRRRGNGTYVFVLIECVQFLDRLSVQLRRKFAEL